MSWKLAYEVKGDDASSGEDCVKRIKEQIGKLLHIVKQWNKQQFSDKRRDQIIYAHRL